MKSQSVNPTHSDDAARRDFWSRRMDEATAFVQAIMAAPVRECGEPLHALRDAVAATGVEVVFSDAPFGSGFLRQFYLRDGLIPAFLAAARDFNSQGLILKVEDAYRTRAMQKSLALKPGLVERIAASIAWECEGRMPDTSFITRRLAAVIAHCPKAGTHMSATAIDMSVLNRDDGSELDRGAPYLEMSVLTPMDCPFIPKPCRLNRERITAIMGKHGFVAYPFEFWHYSAHDAYAAYLSGSKEPAPYGPVDWDPAAGRATPIENPAASLNSDTEIMDKMERTLKGLIPS